MAHDVLPSELVDRNRRRAESVLRQWRPVFIHGDLHVLHVFVEGDSVTGILDWSEAAPGDAAFDLASLTFAHPERLDEVLDGYGNGIDPTLVRARWSYRCLTAVRWLVENGYGPPAEYPEVAPDEDLVLYTTSEVADLLRLNLQVVQRKLQAGEIPAYRIGREWRIERSQLLAWLEQHSNQRRDMADAWFDGDGRLKSLPAKRSLRRPVLARLAEGFDPDRSYAEKEVNEILRRFHEDVASLRREMVAERLFIRSRGGVYKRVADAEPALRRG